MLVTLQLRPVLIFLATKFCGAPRKGCATEYQNSVAHRVMGAPQKYFAHTYMWALLRGALTRIHRRRKPLSPARAPCRPRRRHPSPHHLWPPPQLAANPSAPPLVAGDLPCAPPPPSPLVALSLARPRVALSASSAAGRRALVRVQRRRLLVTQTPSTSPPSPSLPM